MQTTRPQHCQDVNKPPLPRNDRARNSPYTATSATIILGERGLFGAFVESQRLTVSPRLRRRTARRGLVLLMTIAVLAIASILLAVWAKDAIDQHRQLRLRARQLQADWLVESGVDRAAARLAADADYTGENWNIPADELGGTGGAVVVIRAEAQPDEPQSRLVHVAADFSAAPAPQANRVRRSKEVVIELEAPGESP